MILIIKALKGIQVSKKNYSEIEQKNNIYINVYCYEYGLTHPVHISDKKFKNCVDLLVIPNKNKSHYVCIKDFNKFMRDKTKNKNKKHLYRYCLQCFSRERVLVEHKEVCLKINGKQTVKLRSGLNKFKNHFKQLAVPFKIYANFECNMKRVKDENNNTSYTEKYQDHIPCSFAYKVVCIDDKFSKVIDLHRDRNAVYKFIDAVLKEYNYSKILLKNILTKILLCLQKSFS